MKNVLMATVLLMLLSGCTRGPSSGQPAIQEWQGEWGQWSADGRGHNYGASISIFGCDAAALTCRFRYDSESPQSRCGGSDKDRNLLRIAGSRAKGQLYDYEGKPAECYLEFEKIGSSGKKELRLLSYSGNECPDYCAGKPNFPSAYPFKTTAVYPSLATRDCFADARKSRGVWCSDQKIQEFDQQLEGLNRQIQTLNHTNDYRRVRNMREEMLARCEGAADARDCLLSSYTKAVADMQLSEKNAREAHDRDVESMKAPGDPVEGSKLIDRIEGVYKRRFQNTTAAGEKYTSENILEIVRVSEDTVYFRTHIEAYNTSMCSLSGLARYSRKGVLVFVDPQPPFDPLNEPCLLQFEETPKEIRMLDPGHPCARLHCGMRGGFHMQSFPVDARRPIRYMERLKNSREYKEALQQLKR
ncbi:MAG: hypothetical protein LAP85_25930 [Acidobacteriia bacterium]|nr:hypothetical protein [Terriglobia bacterium]